MISSSPPRARSAVFWRSPFQPGFWTRDLPPLDGRLRFVVLALTFWLAQDDVFDQKFAQIRDCPTGFYDPDGVMRFLALGDERAIASFVERLRHPLAIAWIASIVGFGGRVLPLVGALLLFLVVGFERGCTGTGHAWYMPTYAFFVIALFSAPDRFSVDAWLARRMPRYPFRGASKDSLASTGFARKLLVVVVAIFMASAGYSKWAEAGVAWMGGESLQFYLRVAGAPKPWGRFLFDAILEHAWLAQALSSFTILFELAALALPFVPAMRLPYVIVAWGFHLGIMAVMLPEYLPQMTIYLLVVDWGAPFGRSVDSKTASGAAPVERRARLVGTLVTGIFLGAALIRHEYYPFSHVPMYSSLASRDRIGGLPDAAWHDPFELPGIARGYAETRRPWLLPLIVAQRASFSIVTPRGPKRLPLRALAPRIYGGHILLVSRVTEAVAEDLSRLDLRSVPKRALPDGRVVFDATERGAHSHMERTRRLLDLLRPTLERFPNAATTTRLDLVYADRKWAILLASVPLDAPRATAR